jgi:hypothetical protein
MRRRPDRRVAGERSDDRVPVMSYCQPDDRGREHGSEEEEEGDGEVSHI